jgi:hypothetical protein
VSDGGVVGRTLQLWTIHGVPSYAISLVVRSAVVHCIIASTPHPPSTALELKELLEDELSESQHAREGLERLVERMRGELGAKGSEVLALEEKVLGMGRALDKAMGEIKALTAKRDQGAAIMTTRDSGAATMMTDDLTLSTRESLLLLDQVGVLDAVWWDEVFGSCCGGIGVLDPCVVGIGALWW